MGTIFSSNKDFNRVLATQPRASINILKFESPKNFQQQPLANSFSIPTPVRISQTKNQSENTTSNFPNESPIVNEYFEPTEKLIQSNASPAIERTNSSTIINNPIRQKSKEEQPQQQIIAQYTSPSVRFNLPSHHQTTSGDAVVISRSVINQNDQRRTRNHFSSSFRPFYTTVEHNGKQFLVESKERIERRYVQCIDETTHQIRSFEVIDYVPCKIIRPYKHKSQYLSQNDTSQNTFLPTLRSNQRSALSPIPNDRSFSQSVPSPSFSDRSETVTSSDSVDSRSLNSPVNFGSGHDLQHNNVNALLNNKTPQNIQHVSPAALFSPPSASIPRLTTKSATDSIYQHSRPSSLQYLSVDPKNVSNPYSSELFLKQPSSFRVYTPTISDDSASSSTSSSFDSDEETETDDDEIITQTLRSNESSIDYGQVNSSLFNNRNNTAISYGTNHRYSLPTSLDPFTQSLNPNDRHHYRKRPSIQNYDEPVMNNPRFQQSAYPDYAPIPMAMKQPIMTYTKVFTMVEEQV